MKNKILFGTVAGLVTGIAAGIAGRIAVDRIIKEIKGDLENEAFVSPSGDNVVTISSGSSESAKGLTYIKVSAVSEAKADTCELIVFTKKKTRAIVGEWIDNDHFKLTIGKAKRQQCCSVSFSGDRIVANYYFIKND